MSSRDSRQLILARHGLTEVIQADRQHDIELGDLMHKLYDHHFALPVLPKDIDVFALAVGAGRPRLRPLSGAVRADHCTHLSGTASAALSAQTQRITKGISMHQVAQGYLGVWKRRLIQHRSGHSDSETAVYWLQTPRLFADLRIPSNPLPSLALEELSHSQHLALCEQKGFAGVTQIDADICQWHRKMDYQPVSGAEDIGRMRFETSECLIETALDESYYEIWERLPDSLGACRGQWLQAMDDPSRQGCLLLAGDYFLFAASRPTPLTPGTHLRENFSRAENSINPASLFACELSFGRHHAGDTPWKIECSTLPAKTGQCLLPSSVDPFAPDIFANEAVMSSLGTLIPAGGWRCAPDP